MKTATTARNTAGRITLGQRFFKKCLVWVLLPVVSGLLGRCSDTPEPETERVFSHNLLIYMAADNSLSANAKANVDSLLAHVSVPSNHALLLYVDRRNKDAFMIRARQEAGQVFCDTLKVYGQVNSATASVLSTVISDARTFFPATTYGLILWSHGTGWLPRGGWDEESTAAASPTVASPGLAAASPTIPIPLRASQRVPADAPFIRQFPGTAPSQPETKIFGIDGGTQMEVAVMAPVLEQYKHDYIIFDACLMSSVEVCYQLRNAATYMVASAAEILTYGFPYEDLCQTLFPYNGVYALRNFAHAYYNRYMKLSGIEQTATVAVTRLDSLDGLASAFKNVILHGIPDAQIDRSTLQVYDDLHRTDESIFFDLEQVARLKGTQEDYQAFKAILDKTVLYQYTTPAIFGTPVTSYSGLSVFLPTSTLPISYQAFKMTAWNRTVSWVK